MFDCSTGKVTNNQLALVKMALQPRGHRANLAEKFIEFLQNHELKIAARAMLAYQNTAFVFHIGASGDRELRVQELGLRCLVVRGRLPDVKVVVGISRDQLGSSEVGGYSHDIVYMDIPEWTDDFEEQVNNIQKELGYFENSSLFRKPANAYKVLPSDKFFAALQICRRARHHAKSWKRSANLFSIGVK